MSVLTRCHRDSLLRHRRTHPRVLGAVPSSQPCAGNSSDHLSASNQSSGRRVSLATPRNSALTSNMVAPHLLLEDPPFDVDLEIPADLCYPSSTLVDNLQSD